MTSPPAPDSDDREPSDGDAGDRDPGGSDGEAPEGGAADRVRRPTPVRKPRPVAAKPTMPKPVRAGLEPEGETDEARPETAEAELEVEGETWTVRVRGRSRGRTSEGAADLLLLGFHRPGEDEPEREALVVGRSLEALTPMQLEAAWAEGRPPRDPFEPTELFPGTERRRGRGR